MVTLTDLSKVILNGRTLYHYSKGSDKRPLRAKVNGKLQIWKRTPGKFRLPMKHGLYSTFQLTPANAHEWFLREKDAAKRTREPRPHCGGEHFVGCCA